MRKMALLLAGLIVFGMGGTALAHFHTFWPDSRSGYGMPGEKLTWQYFWGHPYEMILFDAQRPVVYVVTPERYRDDVGWRILLERENKHGWMFVMNRWDEGDPSQRDDFNRMLRAAGFTRVYDRWDLRLPSEGGRLHAATLAAIRCCGAAKLLADVCVPNCSYAAIK